MDPLPNDQQQPVLNRPDGVLQPWPLLTASGQELWYMRPQRTQIRWRDLLVGLARNNRYAGQHQLSVLEHLALAVTIARFGLDLDDQTVAIVALHDAAEAYCLEVPKQLKLELGHTYEIVEKVWTQHVFETAGLPGENLWPSSVKQADWTTLAVEKHLLGYGWWVPEQPSPAEVWERLSARLQSRLRWVHASTPRQWAEIVYTALLNGDADLVSLRVQGYSPDRLNAEVAPRWLAGAERIVEADAPQTQLAAAVQAPTLPSTPQTWGAPLWPPRS